ncbi:putative retrotransposon ty1-copia subclass protein [Tanacetum coccineum]
MDGAVHTYKTRLVAKGYTQTLGIDYEETFSPVADIRAIRILIAIAAYYDYEIWQIDVKTAFLNGYLNKEGEACIFLDQILKMIMAVIWFVSKCLYRRKFFKAIPLENSKGSNTMQEKLRLSNSQSANTADYSA